MPKVSLTDVYEELFATKNDEAEIEPLQYVAASPDEKILSEEDKRRQEYLEDDSLPWGVDCRVV